MHWAYNVVQSLQVYSYIVFMMKIENKIHTRLLTDGALCFHGATMKIIMCSWPTDDALCIHGATIKVITTCNPPWIRCHISTHCGGGSLSPITVLRPQSRLLDLLVWMFSS